MAVFTVTTTADAGLGSLRQAILDANRNPGLDTIAFAIGDGGVQTIRPTSSLPIIRDAVILDGTTQSGFAGQPLIVLDGRNAGSSSTGLATEANGCTVRGLVIQFFSVGMQVSSSGDTIAGNYIGTDVTGTQAVGNGIGVDMWSTNSLLGGSTPADRNLISGNGIGVNFVIPENGPSPIPAVSFPHQNRVQGNFIGTDVSGMIPLGNRSAGINLVNGIFGTADGNLIGGTDAGTGNVISGNGQDGVYIQNTRDNTVQGNWIGTDATGTHSLPNGSYGINISVGNTGAPPSTVSNNQIGGTTAAARNLISGNRLGGVHLGAPNPILGNWIGPDLSGTASLPNTIGIVVEGSGITIGGSDPGAGNLVSGNLYAGISLTGNNNQVEGNTIGLDSTGTHALPNGFGVYLFGGTSNQVGGLQAGAGNLISGNLTGIVVFSSRATMIQGNQIGTDAAGSQAIGNFIGVDVREADTLIGGTSVAAGNLISGNLQAGMSISGGGTQVQGNTIGTDITGMHALPNGDGVYVTSGTDQVTIGGTEADTGNLISGNRDAGVVLSGQSSVVAGNWIGTDRSGTMRLGNLVGVRIDGTSNTVGGTAAGARNLVSGNLAQGVAIYGNANLLEGNFIGTDSSGTVALGNGMSSQVFRAGVFVFQGADNRIGGGIPGAGNLISANSSAGIDLEQGRGNAIQGNEIGTDVSGTRAVGNGEGVRIDNGLRNTIGGSAAGAGNLISGNGGLAVNIMSEAGLMAAGNQIQGNYIGTDITGTAALPNLSGISIFGGVDNLIGGVEPSARNVISGNTGGGVGVFGQGNAIQGNYIGTDSSGTRALGNLIGVEIAAANSVGGTTAGAGNIIAGNRRAGIYAYGGPLIIQGNYIGTDRTGMHALSNTIGVDIEPTTTIGTDGLLLGGTQAGAGNVVSGNTSFGIYMNNCNNFRIQGNAIGTDSTGTVALGNGIGIFIESSSHNAIGGTEPGAGNVIAANRSDGIRIRSGTDNVIQGNWIGTDLSGTGPLGNGGDGVAISAGGGFPPPTDTLIGGTAPGAGNRIAFNGQNGVLVNGVPRNAIRQNAIFANGGLGIKLTNGGNQTQAAPVLTTASSEGGTILIQGTLTSTPSTTFTVELFVDTECDPSGFGEGERFLASLTVATDPSGNAGFTLILALPVDVGQFVSATATDPRGNTSQFSNCAQVTMPGSPGPLGRGGYRLAMLPLDAIWSGSPSSLGIRPGVRAEEGLLSVNPPLPAQLGRDAFFAVVAREGWRANRIKDGGLVREGDSVAASWQRASHLGGSRTPVGDDRSL